MDKFVDVILPLPLQGTFTYCIPHDMECCELVGCRVVVPFGPKKHYTALVARVHCEAPEGYEVKSVLEFLDTTPVVTPDQLKLWEWMSKYYLCSVGEIYKAAVPQGLKGEFKPKIETRVMLSAKWRDEK